MHFTSPKEYTDIRMYLDGELLEPDYGKFGISYNVNGAMLFNGQTVRYFWDGFNVDSASYATHYEYLNEDGVVDVRTVRSVIDNGDGSYNPFGELTDIVAYSQQEFDARDIELLKKGNAPATSSNLGISVSNTGGRTIAEYLSDYEKYGITYTVISGGTGNIFYQGRPVKRLVDQRNDGGVRSFSSVHDSELSARVVYDENGTLTGIELY